MSTRYRVGRKVGRTVYTVSSSDPKGDGVLIGVLDTRILASMFVEAANEHDLLRALELIMRDEHVVDRLGGTRLYKHEPADKCPACNVLRLLDAQRMAT